MKIQSLPVIIAGLISLLFVSCGSPVSPEELYGTWKYIKVEHPYKNPPELMPEAEVKAASASIRFTKDSSLVIMWGGSRLSHGKFRIEDKMIRYTENLPGGTTREFPFLVKELSAKKLVFETMEQDASRITATR
jgi:hypothetical protein